VLHLAPSGPLMMCYSGPLGDVHKLVHEEKVTKLGCLMLAKNHPKVIVDDIKLDDARSDYLASLYDSFFFDPSSCIFPCGALQPPSAQSIVWVLPADP